MKYNDRLRRVASFASTDETRPSLMYCVHDSASGALVATDGHRLILDRALYQVAATAFNAKVYLKTQEAGQDRLW